MNDDLNNAVRRDMERFRNMQTGGFDTSIPAMLELGFAAMLSIVVIVWFISMFLWVPDPIPGSLWMGFGMLGFLLFGLPTGLIYLLRRGGVDVIRAMVEGSVR